MLTFGICNTRSLRHAQWVPLSVLVASLFLSGCQNSTLFGSRDDASDIRLTGGRQSADEVRGPLGRLFRPQYDPWNRPPDAAFIEDGNKEVEQAIAAYKAGNVKEALRMAEMVERKNQRWYEKGAGLRLAHKRYHPDYYRYKYRPAREDALALLGEIHFEQKVFPKAEEAYSMLLRDFPNTRHTEIATERMFAIAQVWLKAPKVASSSEIQPVNYDRPNTTPPPQTAQKKSLGERLVLIPNLSDKKRPAFDTTGRGINALNTIFMRDPSGPLADDALMLMASHHFRTGDYGNADYYFELLRSEYPDSPHLESAFVIGSHVKLLAYQGAEYDGDSLQDAATLKESTQRLFPESPENRRIQEDLNKLELMKIERDWKRVEFYQKKGRPKAVAVYCSLIISEYPNSSYAQRARRVLASLPASAKTGIVPLGAGTDLAPPSAEQPETLPDVNGRQEAQPRRTPNVEPDRFSPPSEPRQMPQPSPGEEAPARIRL